tara:strand:- start:2885 stop:3352 length:468 start_codon:yes stop_codon:yes gene_type:complete
MSGLENLNKTWFVDIDGTLLIHKTNEELDEIIEENDIKSHLYETPIIDAVSFINNLPKKDRIILTTARENRHLAHTHRTLHHFDIRYNKIIHELGSGPRVVVNDIKPAGTANNQQNLNTAYAINVNRDQADIQGSALKIERQIQEQMSPQIEIIF